MYCVSKQDHDAITWVCIDHFKNCLNSPTRRCSKYLAWRNGEFLKRTEMSNGRIGK